MNQAKAVLFCSVLVSFVTIASTANDSFILTSNVCDYPFVFVGDRCYSFYRGNRRVTQAQARLKCRALDSQLAKVTNEETHTALKEWIDSHEYRLTSYWISLFDLEGIGKFRYPEVAGETEFTAWGEGQPGDPAPSRKCVVMSAKFAHDWEAVACFRRNFFICEKEVPLSRRSLFRSTNDIEQFCDFRSIGYYADPTNCKGYILCHGTNIYKYSCPRNEIFNPDRLLCEIEGTGTTCQTENEVTTSATPLTEEPDHTTVEVEEDLYGNDLYGYGDEDYEDYEEYEDENVPGEVIEGCEETGTEEEDAGNYAGYICEDGYVKSGKKCYKISYKMVSWNVANQICIGEEDGRLVMIKSRAVQQFLNRQMRRSDRPIYEFWIGLNDQETEDVYVWSDGSRLCESRYENWSDMSRRRYPGKKKCVQMRKKRGLWDDNICSIENGFICEKDAVNPSTSAPIEETAEPAQGRLPGWKSRNLLCGTIRRQNSPLAVVGGIAANVSEHPWQASLRSSGRHTCGGTLIDNCWVLTAAHCVDQRSTGPTKVPTLVVLGDVDTSVPEGKEKYLAISEIILHPTWIANPVPTDDIALVKLRKCVDDLNPICLPGRDFDEFGENDNCKVAGWGSMDADRRHFPNRLQEATVPILSQSVCRQKYMLNGRTMISSDVFCAGFLRGGVDACQGDSGGPLSCKGVKSSSHSVQWGIVSWGFGCAEKNRPGVYARVASYMDWIRNHTKIDF